METVTAPRQTGPQSPGASGHQGQHGRAVGHIARQAVTAATVAGADLPRNAQGFAASLIAKGADPESLFSAAVARARDVLETSATKAAISAYEFNAPAVSTSVLAPADAETNVTAPL